ncbi:tRNA(Met) cytidine acetyltransferase TmcA [Raoultella ornithinolytica]|jgi:tRNA(Met) cytidine acetyltransferase|uniref:tRNA(Met) cytidine acetyltransferase TmcA n=1 Tax=Raoultella ornithinolytica TaxID=54291 RepID=UPI0002CD0BBA|nr:GNAT family N-acetyltransferase [Raoultella ornithinolytica]AGJ84804.1 methionine tRNA cytidine acetyltransferase [Raoultella ornithinolytica B6]ASI59665.1 tRNA cytosine(34) acetyltransferase TmcA [Raoultella ornithinolytica]EKQ7998056.1 tRNA(Met) cytidine acetyltransferase [Raoultella ornithinolytica]EKU0196740.1 tRNA(Met) cytidine acetyltransferase [Raoultella ornithinolytica]EKV4101221.1 tRNA(Met) cytidine acetyltransferase [Raoultella ornithinolytica]
MDQLLNLTARMAQQGIRRLLVLSGDDAWCLEQALLLRKRLAGDGLWVGPQPMEAPCISPEALKSLLGREYRHAFFDARSGFDAAAFAALSGTLKAGSWLILLTPSFTRWPTRPDADSLRWSDAPEPIPTPHFVHRFCQRVCANPEAIVWRQNEPLTLPEEVPRPRWHPADGHPQAGQAAILASLSTLPAGIAVVTAERGRGKSALAGMLIRQLAGDAIVTAPARGATEVMAAFAGEGFRFIAPDALLAGDMRASWLIVDEAAAIPGPLLRQLVTRFPRTLLTTTVQGYEGTGRGFLLKFCASFPHLRQFSLLDPIRWAAGCPLEAVVSELLLFGDESFTQSPAGEVTFEAVSQDSWRQQDGLAEAMYQLLSGAHYRTSPLDLRRMMDAPGQHFTCARTSNGVAGALWRVAEGGLDPALSRAVWAGFRRPRGNLVAQSLAAHGGSPLAATLLGQRITRIAVHPTRQREGLGQALVARAVAQSHGLDYLSVSFGYTPELGRFWQRCGFTLVRLGTHREASSGCYTAMALYPLTSAGHELVLRESQRLARDEFWLWEWREALFPRPVAPAAMLTDDDWLDVAGFAFAHRPLLAVVGSLNRLLLHTGLPLPALRARLQRQDEAEICTGLRLSGRKALLARLREEAGLALLNLDASRAERLRQQVGELQFF